MKYTISGPVDSTMATEITTVSMTTDHIMHKAPDIKRRHREHRNAYANHRKSAVELLEASKSEYVKSSRVLNHRQELKHPENLCVGNRDGISSPSHSTHEDKIKTEPSKTVDCKSRSEPPDAESSRSEPPDAESSRSEPPDAESCAIPQADDTWTAIVAKVSDNESTSQVESDECSSVSKFKKPITPPKLPPKPTVPAKPSISKPRTPPKSTAISVPSPVSSQETSVSKSKSPTPQKCSVSVPSQAAKPSLSKSRPVTPPKPSQLLLAPHQTSSSKSSASGTKQTPPLKTSPEKPVLPPKPDRRSTPKPLVVPGDGETPPPVPERRSSTNIVTDINANWSTPRREHETRTNYGNCDESKSNRSDIKSNSIVSGGTDITDSGVMNTNMSGPDDKGAVRHQDQIVKRFSSLSANSPVMGNKVCDRDVRLPGIRKMSGSSTRSRETKESHSNLSSPSDALLKPIYSNKLSTSVGVLAETRHSPLPRPKSDKLPDDFGMPKRRQLHRSQSDLSSCRHSRTGSDFSDMSSRVSRTSTEVERFFNEMGLDRTVIEPMLRLQDTRPKGIMESLSSFGSEDAHSVRSRVSQTDMDKVPVESEPDLIDRTAEGTSIVERNARIIKWLCNVKKAHHLGPKKSVATS